jgi:DNA-binding NtrC family response regulator
MARQLLAITELGGYPDFTPEYQRAGFEVTSVKSVRKAVSSLKKQTPDVIVTEFNFQSDFRDRTSSIETLMASLQNTGAQPKLIVFYEPEYEHQFDRVRSRFTIDYALTFPIKREQLVECLNNIYKESANVSNH